ncbi:hypothetical protein ACE11G_04060 [Gordonia sp. PS3]|nr:MULTISPECIES: hypothetical protein [Gordonia]WFN92037.1 hypothetical protein P5P27_14830 [Gordonia sihwensis]
MTISSRAMRRSPAALAREIMALCTLASTTAGVQARHRLRGRGVDEEALDLLGLPSRKELVNAEAAADASSAGRNR